MINRENQKIFTTSKTVVKNPTHNASVGIWKMFVLKRMRQWRLRRIYAFMRGAEGTRNEAYLGMWVPQGLRATKQKSEKTSKRSSEKEHRADALALGADEGRDKLR